MAGFSLSRSIRIEAAPGRVHPLLDDFREWQKWSPWEGLDPDMSREYTGPDHGVGSTYRWSGNKKAGEGEMHIRESTPASVVVDLEFLKPFRATNVTTFALAPATYAGDSTDVTWTMTGERSAIMSVMGRLFFDKSIGSDFDRGLVALKREAERA
ncbi:transcriptional regulator [Nocardioides sp. Root122]|uniref:SRPBCC family protein n=1 Tax=Nocardioides TaxID=1839 RepID=UPI000703C0F3|nr:MULTISPECIES: SRPBCC family protein [Nocardioides]KQV65912.1 transcriptional regulator [Nocardioides sp. Root122]MCK9823153.1 SRPBCC family protein [Nocardioides cavernae]